jgi:quinol monooxygenase YgiN/predicted ester cyclase
MKTAFVTLHAKNGDAAQSLEKSLLHLQALSWQEPGKIRYEVFQSETVPLSYFVRESWQDEDAFERHINTPHLQQFVADTGNWLTQPFDAVMLKELSFEGERKSNAGIIKDLYEAVNNKDLDFIRNLGASFSEWLDVPFNYTTRGESAIIDPWVSWFGIFPDATCEVKSLIAFGDYVIAQGIGRGTHKGVFHSPAGVIPPSNVKMQVNFCDVYKLKDGKIERADSYFDFFSLWKQLTERK